MRDNERLPDDLARRIVERHVAVKDFDIDAWVKASMLCLRSGRPAPRSPLGPCRYLPPEPALN
jgi:hypothetical protein